MSAAYVTVPVDPTPEMIDAGLDAYDSSDAPENEVARIYTAMLAAAPKPGAGWVSVEDRLPVLPEENEDDGVKVWTWDGEFVTEDEFVPEFEQPAGPAVGGWLRTGEWFASDNLNRVTHWMPRVVPLPPIPTQEQKA